MALPLVKSTFKVELIMSQSCVREVFFSFSQNRQFNEVHENLPSFPKVWTGFSNNF